MKPAFASHQPRTAGIVLSRHHADVSPVLRRFRVAPRFRLSPLMLALSTACLIGQPLPGHSACVPAAICLRTAVGLSMAT